MSVVEKFDSLAIEPEQCGLCAQLGYYFDDHLSFLQNTYLCKTILLDWILDSFVITNILSDE